MTDPDINTEELALTIFADTTAAQQALCNAASLLASDHDDRVRLEAIAKSLERSVIRALQAHLGDVATAYDQPGDANSSLQTLALRMTELRAAAPDVPEFAEAAAALQRLALQSHNRDIGNAEDNGMDAGSSKSLARELQAAFAESLAETDTGLSVMKNGPYLATGVEHLSDYLGCEYETQPQMALCRCGASQDKPYCDGSHRDIGFTDEKNNSRQPDRRNTYEGQQVTIYDNRGICQHSGFCTDRLSVVFRLGEEPFVAPSGGRMDEIIRTVRSCPSGALSYGIDGVEQRGIVDHNDTREPTIEVTKDGPYRITGGAKLSDAKTHQPIERNKGSSTEHYALCRCGQSQNKPFCSGMHWYVEFHDPAPITDRTPTMFEWAGGYPALLRMTRLFYEKYVPQDEYLAPLFSTMSADHPERVATWLGEVFGGPKRYSEECGGYPRMLAEHRGKCIKEEWRVRWVSLLLEAAREAGLPNDPEFRSGFQSYIEWGSRLAVENSQIESKPPQNMPMPHWDWNTSAGPPGSRISALQQETSQAEQAIVFPGEGETPSYAAHVKQLFRERDRTSMMFKLDLWEYDDVSEHADAILAEVEAGRMPCDGVWQADRIELLRQWIASGKLP